MGKLVELCNSTYNHTPLTSFGKRYYKHRFKDKIICEECLSIYLKEASNTLATEIFNCIKSVDMRALSFTKDGMRDNNFSFTFEKEILSDFMRYIIPIKFTLKISFLYEVLKGKETTVIVDPRDPYFTSVQDVIDNAPNDSIVDLSRVKYVEDLQIDKDIVILGGNAGIEQNHPQTIGSLFRDRDRKESRRKNDESIVRIAKVSIIPTVCDSTYPSFDLCLDIRNNDTFDSISKSIEDYLSSFVFSFFFNLPDLLVQTLMNKKGSASYSSLCSASSTSPSCAKCSVSVSSEHYIYNNSMYCLDCMYAIVVQASVDSNISDLVGLSVGITTTNSIIRDTDEWKRAVIDKYINVMRSFGLNPNITHYTMTCQC